MTFFHSLFGTYITQTILHSFLTLILVELSFFVWDIQDHFSKFRYRILTLTLPVIMFPVYQIITPERGTWHFRLTTALFDSHGWLDLKVFGIYPVAGLFGLLLIGVSFVFFMQEIYPIFRERGANSDYHSNSDSREKVQRIEENILLSPDVAKPTVVIIEENFPILFTKGTKNHTIYISDHLICQLNEEQLRGALTHETVHMIRGSSLKMQSIYLSRMLMFYNPISLVEFRRIVHDEEFICDEIAVSKTGNPEALIKALTAFYYKADGGAGKFDNIKDRVEVHSHNLLLDARIARLKLMKDAGNISFSWLQYGLTAAAILLMGYVVV